MNKQIKYSFLLLLISIIWGFAFAFQSLGGDNLSTFTFYSFRSYFSVITMFILLTFKKDKDIKGNIYSIKLGLVGGLITCAAYLFQQESLKYTTAANSSFITSIYVALVPALAIFLGKKTNVKTWVCVALEFVGLYLLCIKGDFSINKGDLMALVCSILFAIHILLIDNGANKLDSIIFCTTQYVVCAIVTTILMFIFDRPINIEGVKASLIPLVYTGCLSSAVCITLQVEAQKHMNPTLASLILCLEGVFGAIGGWLILGQTLSTKEFFGCAIIFVAIIISQINNE